MSIADAIEFEDSVEIMEDEMKINFYIPTYNDLLTKLVVDDSFFDNKDYFVNIYINYDCDTKQIDDHLEFVLHMNDETKEIDYPLTNLSDRDKEKIINKMNDYCRNIYNQTMEEMWQECVQQNNLKNI